MGNEWHVFEKYQSRVSTYPEVSCSKIWGKVCQQNDSDVQFFSSLSFSGVGLDSTMSHIPFFDTFP